MALVNCDKCGHKWDYNGIFWRRGKRVYPRCPKCKRYANIHKEEDD